MATVQDTAESPRADAPPVQAPRRDWALLSAAVFLFALGFAIYGVIFINYITEVRHVDPKHYGALESLREVPGLLAVFIAGIAAAYAETRVGAVCLALSALGVAATGFVHSYAQLVLVTVFWSVFMHQWFTTSSAIPLALANGKEGGRHLGRLGTIGAAATILALVFVHEFAGRVPYSAFFAVAGVLIFIAGLLLLPMSSHGTTTNRPRLLYRREYSLYYFLSFLEGCRRQIFSTFAILALVQICHAGLGEIAVLSLVNSIVSFLVAAPVGRLVDRLGERRVMTFYYLAITLAFSGYALTTYPPALKVIYVIDNALFAFGVSITTFLNRTVRPGELMPTLSMGQTMNHIAAVAVPVTGGLLWAKFGYQMPFWTGVISAIVSLIATQRVGERLREAETG
jgi:MFS family permease